MASNDVIQTDRIDLIAAISINDHSEVMIDSELDSSLDTCSVTDRDISGLLDDNLDTGSSKFQKRYLSMTEDDGVTPLHKACARGDLEQVNLLCNTRNIETPDKFHNRPIHVASIFCHIAVVHYLYEHKCDINATGWNNNRPIHYASKHGHLDIVRFLCEKNCNIEAPGWNNNRPIHYASKHGHLDIVRFLCEKNCDIEAPGLFDRRPIHYACECGHLDIVRFLCEKNCNIEAAGWFDRRPIHYACECGHLYIVMFLCEKNCDIEASDENNNRPIHYASKHGHLDIVRFLCEKNCDIEVPGLFDCRPIHYACEHGHLDIVRFLCEKNCDIEASNKDSNRPIHYACEYGHLDIVRFLCEKNCNIEASNKDSNRPIHYACEYGHLDIVRFLCEKNCNIEAPGWINDRPIHYASKHGHLETVRFLCDQNCDMNASDMNKNKPIHYACKNGHLDIVRFLCEQNCDFEAANCDNYKPIDLAKNYRRIDIVKYLSKPKNHIKDSDTMGISVLPSESKKRQLIEKIQNMKINCEVSCNHSSCLQSIYDTKSIIGRGGFGSVYKVKDPQLIYTFCMKSIKVDPNAINRKPKHIEFNIKDYRHVLHHDRIVQYFGIINMNKKMLLFMEYVEGVSLDKHVNRKPLPHNKVIQYSKEILEGLNFLHQNKIIHRDIKPQNIMLDKVEHVKLCDFGLSCYLESIAQRSQIQTGDPSDNMTNCGTPNYMAPEIINEQKYSYPVDIWGLGASIVEMLTGLPPFHGIDKFAVMLKIFLEKKIEFVPAEPMSQDMKSFVDQMLCSSPSERATAEMLLKFIDARF